MDKFFINSKLLNSLPNCLPLMSSGKLNYKVRVRKDAPNERKELPVFIQVTLHRKIKRIPLGFSVLEKDFDLANQRVKAKHPYCNDYNLLIEKQLADINTIEVAYRLSNKILGLDQLIEELKNPTAKMDFIQFWENEMEKQKDILKPGTYRQQMTVLNKVKEYKSPLFFYEITEDYINHLKAHCKRKLKNNDNTVASLIKSFKKYLHLANKKGIQTPIDFSDIKNKSFKGQRTFLMPDELKTLHEFWESNFISDIHKNILARFLFSCFTGLRFADVKNLTEENIIENMVVFSAEKTGKFQRIKLNKSALQFLYVDFFKTSSTNEYTNRELKQIAKACKISKNITYHVSRHTFATNFLICDGRVEHLQKLLGHSKIEETMIYVHIVEEITNLQIGNMDEILF